MSNCYYIGRKQRTLQLLAAAVGFMYVSLAMAVSASETMYFIHGQPNDVMPGKRPYPTVIYELLPKAPFFEKVWSLDENIQPFSINLIYSARKVVVYERLYTEEQRLHVISMDNPAHRELVDLRSFPIVVSYHYLSSSENSGSFFVHYSDGPVGPGMTFKKARVSIIPKEQEQNDKLSFDVSDIRLAGVRSPHGGGESDVLSVHMGADGALTLAGLDLVLDWPPVPDSIVTMKTSFGWVVIGNEADFRVLSSVPERSGLTHRELLILNIKSGQWNSMLIEGVASVPRLVNGWLVGIIADHDPETNYDSRKFFPPLLREESVLVDPLSLKQFTVHLGKDSEVLWAGADTAYYRVGQSLYRARVADDGFSDRELVVTDPLVEHIHWAFSGPSGE